MNPVLWALAANFCFATASIAYSEYSRRLGVLWMNIFKAIVGVTAFGLVLLASGGGYDGVSAKTLGILFFSGFIGFGIGDMLLLNSFKIIGPGRTLILFGFQPVTVGIMGYLILGQTLNSNAYVAVLFFILCLLSFSIEHFKVEKSFGVVGLGFALGGVFLDSTGNVLTRLAFDQAGQLSSIAANIVRLSGGLTCYFLFSLFINRPKMIEKFRSLEMKERIKITIVSVMGTFLSLLFYLTALKSGTLAVISGVGITGPLFSTLFEHIAERKLPSLYVLIAIGFFLIGFSVTQGGIL